MNGKVKKMKEIKVKVPDNTMYMHVVIGVDEDGYILMYSKSSAQKDNLDMVIGKDKGNE